MQAVIMAGGKGTRLQALTLDEIPKPLVKVAGKPILQWQIECLKRNNITEILVVTGHLGNQIEDFFGTGENFGVSLRYYRETTPLGSAGALYKINLGLLDQDFLLVFGDLVFDIYVSKMKEFHLQNNAMATLFVHPNNHPYDSDLIVLGGDDSVTALISKNTTRDKWYDNIVNAGIYFLNRNICDDIPETDTVDLEKDILLPLINEHARVFGYRSTEYVKDVGTVERIKQVESNITAGVVSAKNLSKPQKCIFLDRDGTLNVLHGLVHRVDDFELEPMAAKSISLINSSDYLSIVITNQPVIARGLCDFDTLEDIHKKMLTLLGDEQAYLDALYYCPHHPDKGYPEEVAEYKIVCECRKPAIGMISDAVSRYNISLKDSWFIGDTTVDIQTGKNAGLKTILVKTGVAGTDGKYSVKPDFECDNVLEAVVHILGE